jgi:two-component system, OmpR family, alkaline phosphatase synthesis response regulator PhoP
MSRVLVVEDEKHIADGLRFNLEAESYEVSVVDNGEAALALLQEQPGAWDLLVLDVMLPGRDGFSVMRELRDAGELVPTLMLTARSRPEDVLRGFEAGADDYLHKPFDLSILLARLKGLLRRSQWKGAATPAPGADVYRFDGRRIDFSQLRLHWKDQTLPLTLMEANLLRYFILHEGRAVSRREILEQVWQVHEDTDTRAIDNFIVRLRRYIEDDPAQPRYLLTVRGVGYRFVRA